MKKRIKFVVLLIFILVVCLGLTSCLETIYTNIKDKFNTSKDSDEDEQNENPDKPDDGGTDPVEPETPGSTEITIKSITITEEGFLLGYTSEEQPSSENFSGTIVFKGVWTTGVLMEYTCNDTNIVFGDGNSIEVKVGDFDGLSVGGSYSSEWEYVRKTLPEKVVLGYSGEAYLEFKLIDKNYEKEYTFTYTFNSNISSWERTGI